MSLRTLMQGPLPVTAPLVLNPLMAKLVEELGFSAWKTVYEELADSFGAKVKHPVDYTPVEHDMLKVIGIEKLLAIERATGEKAKQDNGKK